MRVEVENLRGFRQVAVDFADARGRPRQTTVALGESGSGKTSLLCVMAVGLAPQRDARALLQTTPGIWLARPREPRNAQRDARGAQRDARGAQRESPSAQRARGVQREARVHVELCDPGAPAERFGITTWIAGDAAGHVRVRQETEPARDFPWQRVLVGGYGAQRGLSTGRAARQAARTSVASLFRRDARLLSPRAIAAKLGPALGPKLIAAAWGHAGAILGDRALGDSPGLPGLDDLDDLDDLYALGDSAWSVLSWLVDLLGHAHAAGALDAQARPSGIALVDAIDAHLHPSAQRQLLARLARRFPDLQLVATAQSPETVVNRAAGEVLVCRRQGRARTVAQDLPALTGRNADEILRGPWFGLPATVDDHTARLLARHREAVRTGASEPERARLREEVRRRVGYFVATPLDELAAEVMAALERDLDQPGERSGEARQALVEEAMRRLRRRLDRT